MRRLVWALVAVLCVGCPKKHEAPAEVVDAGPTQLGEREPNDRPDQAMALTDSTVVTASLGADPSHPDEDWYALTPAAPRVVDVTVSGIPGVDVVLEVYDTDRNRLLLVNSEGEGKPERFPDLAVTGKLLVRVTAARRGTGGAYTLTALFSEPASGFEAEPNNRAADSNELKLGEAVPDGWKVSGLVGYSGDEDWYRIDLLGQPTAAPPADGGAPADAGPPAAAQPEAADGGGGPAGADAGTDAGLAPPEPKVALRIELTGVEGVKPELQVLSAAQAPLFVTQGKEGEALSLRNVGVRATDQMVYVVVRGGWSGPGKGARRTFNPDKPYTLTVSKEAAGANAELEPNNDLDHATPLPPGGFREGFLSPKTDVDYYVLQSPQPVIANVQVSGVDRLDLVLSLVKRPDKPGAPDLVLIKANDGAVKEPEYLNNIACFNACYFKVEGALRKEGGKWLREYENADQPYRISVNTVPDTGALEREPNDTPEQATPVSFGKPIRGTIQPKRDVDNYRLDLSDRQVKTPLKVTVTGILKVDIALKLYRLTDEGKELVQSAGGKGDAPRVVRYAAEPGVYILEVADARNRESNFQDSYQLTVEEGE